MINIELICDNPMFANTYVVGDNTNCVIIDPSMNAKNYLKAVKGRKVLGILLTHGHYDHFKELKDVQKNFATKVYLHKEAFKKLQDINASCSIMFGCLKPVDIENSDVIFINDGGYINLETLSFKVIFTPGHTNCSVCYLIDNHLFSGDTLFNNGVGRTDLPTSSTILLNNSIKQLMKKRDYFVYPGHGEMTSINQESKNNYYYQMIK